MHVDQELKVSRSILVVLAVIPGTSISVTAMGTVTERWSDWVASCKLVRRFNSEISVRETCREGG